MEDILEIELFGVKHKIKTDDDMSHACYTAEFLENEVARIEREFSEKPSGLNHFVKLLLATLNISKEYIKLKHGYGELEETVSEKYLGIVKRLTTDLDDSDQLSSGLFALAETGCQSGPEALPGASGESAGSDEAEACLPQSGGEPETGLCGDDTDQAGPAPSFADAGHESVDLCGTLHRGFLEDEELASLEEWSGELSEDPFLPDSESADIAACDADALLAGLPAELLKEDDSQGPVDDAELPAVAAHMEEEEPETLPVDAIEGVEDESKASNGPLAAASLLTDPAMGQDADESATPGTGPGDPENRVGHGLFQADSDTGSPVDMPVAADQGSSVDSFAVSVGNTEERAPETPVETEGGTLADDGHSRAPGPVQHETGYDLPPLCLLDLQQEREYSSGSETFQLKAELLEAKLNDFGVKGEVTGISPGPVITTFEYKPAAGVKISKIVNLTDDLALALSALSIRIVAPIPGRDVVGIEIPNVEREIVSFRDLVDSPEFRNLDSTMGLCLGKDIVGTPVVAQLNKMPHLLIAGATGTGKSVGLNAMITSLLYKASPDEVKFIMIDPKRIELSFYNGIPHLISPVVTDMKKATNALFWAVREMERRYDLLAANKVRNVNQYNRKMEQDGNGQKLPFIVIIIDELADLMMTASRDVEVSLARLAQMARAAGIHMILATQRPSVDVLTGTIKANFPTRISFQVSSKIDSRTIIDTNGAETLLGNGDMLFVPPGTARLARIHGAYISEEELIRIIEFVRHQQEPEYNDEVTAVSEEAKGAGKNEEYDERYDEAVALVTRTRQASISSVQRHLRIGYNRSARIIEMMESNGIVGPADGAKGRTVLVQSFDEMEP